MQILANKVGFFSFCLFKKKINNLYFYVKFKEGLIFNGLLLNTFQGFALLFYIFGFYTYIPNLTLPKKTCFLLLALLSTNTHYTI